MRSLNVVAHADDDLLFLNPDILQDDEFYNLYVTAGDDGYGIAYITTRCEAARSAYTYPANTNLNFLYLKSNSFRNGDLYGELYRVWSDEKYTTETIYGNQLESNGLIAWIENWIEGVQPDIIRTHDPDAEPAIDHDEPHLDHIDHIYTAKFVQEAAKAFSSIPVYAYMGYPIRYQAPNVSPELTQQKLAMWRKYQEIDTSVAGEQWDIAMSRCYKRRIQ